MVLTSSGPQGGWGVRSVKGHTHNPRERHCTHCPSVSPWRCPSTSLPCWGRGCECCPWRSHSSQGLRPTPTIPAPGDIGKGIAASSRPYGFIADSIAAGCVFHLFRHLIFFIKALQFSVCILSKFAVITNTIAFFIPFLGWTLLVDRNETDIWILIQYPAALANLLSSNNFWWILCSFLRSF